MEDQLVSYKTAKRAKEKGFDEWVHAGYYSKSEQNPLLTMGKLKNSLLTPHSIAQISAPTQSLLQRWLREKAQVIVEVIYEQGNWYHRVYWAEKEEDFVISMAKSTYEIALDEGLFIALALLT